MPIPAGGLPGREESAVRQLIELVRTHPLHAGVVGFFLFVIISALFLERARYHHR